MAEKASRYEYGTPSSGREQDANYELPHPAKLTGIVLQKIVSPRFISSVATILRNRQTNRFVRAEKRCKLFRFTPDAKNKDPIPQSMGNLILRKLQSTSVAVEVDQKNHESLWPTLHFPYVDSPKKLQDGTPTACRLQQLHLSQSIDL